MKNNYDYANFDDPEQGGDADNNNNADDLAMYHEEYQAYGAVDHGDHYNENLGEDFEDTPWVPPSAEFAEEYKRKHIYREGKADLSSLRLTHVADLGVGVPLYFQFVKSAANYMLVCTVLSIPLLVFAYSGSNVPPQARDGLGLFAYTFGNIGYNALSSTYATASACTLNINANNGTCIHFYGSELTSINASYVVTGMEVLQVLIFYLVLFYLANKTKTFKLSTERQICSVTDYSIIVRNIPPDTSEEQLIGHFSRLYPLDKPDWQGRPPLENAAPVNDVDNTNEVMYYNTWVAEVNTHRKIGRFVTAFKEQQDLMARILRARAKMKMYSETTCHAEGYNPKKHEQATKEMLQAGAKLDHLTEKIAKQKNMILLEDEDEHEDDQHASPKSAKSAKSNKSKKSSKSTKADQRIVADACAGFVIFQYPESMARCIEDYQLYDTFPMSLLTPTVLKLRGRSIQVKPAPQPDEMIWENIEVTEFQKRMRRLRSTFYTVVLLILSFIAILQAESVSKSFLKQVPPLKLCSKDVPAIYSGNYVNHFAQITRPPDGVKAALDAKCESAISGSFYAIYAVNGDFSKPVAAYDFSACQTSSDLCPSYHESPFCPCVSATSSASCSTIGCASNYTRIDNTQQCYAFSASLIGGCYCMLELSQLSSSSVSNVASPQCKKFLEGYAQAKGIVYCVTVITVVINSLLLSLQVYLTKQESHMSIDKMQGSLMLKIFISTYFNLAVVYLLVFGYIPSIDSAFLQATYIFQGSYEDFNSEWYGAVGSAFIISFLLQALTPIGMNLGYYLVLGPLLRWYSIPQVLAHKSHDVVMQQDFNLLHVGPEFDITVATAQNLALVFFAMTYASALPLLMPLSCITLLMSYYTDKLLICRYYMRPPYSGTGVMTAVLGCLSYLGIIRLAISCWVFSNPEVFDYESIYSVGAVSASYSDVANSHGYLPAWMESRLVRSNVFPLIIFILLILVSKLVPVIIWLNPLKIILSYMSCLYYACRSNKVHAGDGVRKVRGYDLVTSNDDLRQEAAPFTDVYFKYVSDNTAKMKAGHQFFKHMDNLLSDQEKKDGWQLKDQGRYTVKQKHWMRVVKESGKVHNVGEAKKTFEVIADHGCNSYALEKVPAYKLTMIGLREGTASMATTKMPSVAKSTKSGKVVMSKTPSILGVYKKAAKRTSLVEDFHGRRKSRENNLHKDMEAAVTASNRNIPIADAEVYDYQPPPSSKKQPETFKFADQPKVVVGAQNQYDLSDDEGDQAGGENEEERRGSLFGTGLGSNKYFAENVSDEEYDRQREAELEAELEAEEAYDAAMSAKANKPQYAVTGSRENYDYGSYDGQAQGGQGNYGSGGGSYENNDYAEYDGYQDAPAVEYSSQQRNIRLNVNEL